MKKAKLSDKIPALKSKFIRGAIEIVISLLAMMSFILIVYFTNLPNPNMILIAILVICTSLFGYPSGIASGILMLLYSLFFFSTNHKFFVFTEQSLIKVIVSAIGIVVCVLFIGILKYAQSKSKARLEEINSNLESANVTLAKASSTDFLTHTKNRRAFLEDCSAFLRKPLHVMLVDIDDFKSINDNYGHGTGDKTLILLAKALADAFSSETVFRFGGDEFLVVAIDTQNEVFEDKVKDLKQTLDNMVINSEAIPLRFSAGYVYGEADSIEELHQMIREADTCLYGSKRKGKNCFTSAKYVRK